MQSPIPEARLLPRQLHQLRPQRLIRALTAIGESLFGIELLQNRDSTETLQLAPLGTETISKILPAKWANLIAAINEPDRSILLTPLVVSALRRSTSTPASASITQVLREAAESVIRWNNFALRHLSLEPLALVGWIYYRRFRRELTVSEIKIAAGEVIAGWRSHRETRVDTDTQAHALGDCVERLSACTHDSKLEFMLRRSFFFPTTVNTFLLSNEAWRDFLVTFYLSLCIRHEHASELGGTAFRVDHFERAGDLLGDMEIDDGFILRFIDTANRTGDPFILGNLGSFLGISRIPISGAASDALVAACEGNIQLSKSTWTLFSINSSSCGTLIRQD